MSGKLTRADQKKLEQLKGKLDIQQRKIAQQQKKNATEGKTLAQEKKKISNQWKELKNAQKQVEADRNFLKKHAKGAAPAKGGGGGNNKALQKELMEMKKKFNAESKRARENKMMVDQLTAELKVVKQKLKNASGKKAPGEDPRIRHMMKEIKKLNKKIRMLYKELNKKRRWFQRTIKQFKTNQQYWLRQQQEATKKGIAIKYVFLDDVQQIKQYRDKKAKGPNKYQRKIRVKSKGGGEIVIHNVDIKVYDTDEEGDPFATDSNSNSKGGKKGKKGAKGAKAGKGAKGAKGAKGKKGKKGKKDSMADVDEQKGDDDDELSAFMASIMSGLEDVRANVDGEDDMKSLDSGDDGLSEEEDFENFDGLDSLMVNNTNALDSGRAQSIAPNDSAALESRIIYLTHEMEARTRDLEALKCILSGTAPSVVPSPQESESEEKGDENESESDLKNENSDGNTSASAKNTEQAVEQLLENIKQRQSEMVDNMQTRIQADMDTKELEQGNNQWQLWLNKFSDNIAANAVEFDRLCAVYDYFLRELDGRGDDLNTINDIFYAPPATEEETAEEVKANNDSNENENNENADEDNEASALIDDEDEDEEEEDVENVDGDDDGDADNKESEANVEADAEAAATGDNNNSTAEDSCVSFVTLDKSLAVRHSGFEQELQVGDEQDGNGNADAGENESEEKDDSAVNADDDEEAQKDLKAQQANKIKVDNICKGFIECNVNWKSRIGVCSKDHQLSVDNRTSLVNELVLNNQALNELISKVEAVPSTNLSL